MKEYYEDLLAMYDKVKNKLSMLQSMHDTLPGNAEYIKKELVYWYKGLNSLEQYFYCYVGRYPTTVIHINEWDESLVHRIRNGG